MYGIWNDLPSEITSSPSLLSLLTFKQRLKVHLFRRSYPQSYLLTVPPCVVLQVAVCCLGHVKNKID